MCLDLLPTDKEQTRFPFFNLFSGGKKQEISEKEENYWKFAFPAKISMISRLLDRWWLISV